MNTTIESIATLAATVAAEHTASVEAHASVTSAETALLERIVEAARPALRAVSTRRRTSERTFWPDSACSATKYTPGPLALRVAGDGPDEDHPRAILGTVEGCDLYLYPDGTFVEATYTGSWSRWRGEGSSWETTDRVLTTAEVAAEYNVDDIVTAISEALSRARGTREKPTARAIERAEKIRAVAALVK